MKERTNRTASTLNTKTYYDDDYSYGAYPDKSTRYQMEGVDDNYSDVIPAGEDDAVIGMLKAKYVAKSLQLA